MMRRRSMSRPWNPKASRGWVRLPAMQSSRLFPVAYEAKVVSGRKIRSIIKKVEEQSSAARLGRNPERSGQFFSRLATLAPSANRKPIGSAAYWQQLTSLDPQCVDGIQIRRFAGGSVSEQHSYSTRNHERHRYSHPGNAKKDGMLDQPVHAPKT